MPFQYYGTQLYSGSAAANPDRYYTGSNSSSYVGGFIVTTGSADIYTTQGVSIRATDLTAGTFYPFEVNRISGGSSAYIYVLTKKG